MKVKKIKIILVIFAFCFGKINNSIAQQWGTPQIFGGVNPVTTNKFNDVYFPTYTDGYIVGNAGAILATTDGGKNWTVQSSGTTVDLKAVYFANSFTGWACGANGVILNTTNGGTTWQILTSGTTQTLNTIYFNGSFGMVGGTNGTLLKTTSSGTSWTSVSNPFTSVEITSISFPNSGNLNFYWVATKNGNCGVTTNSGVNWAVNASFGAAYGIKSIHARNTNPGDVWCVGALGLKKKTNDNGATWTSQTMGTTNTLNDVHFSNQSSLYGHAVGENGTIVCTTNGGLTWGLETSTTTQRLNSIFMLDTQTGFAVGDSGTILLYGISVATNVKDELMKDDVTVYPVPAFSEINAELSFKPKAIKVFNNLGREITSASYFPINIRELEDGVYFIQIFSESNFITKKIIVSK